MRRVALAVFGTIAALVGLLTFKTHAPTAATPVAVGSPAAGSTTSPASPDTSSPDSSGTSSSTSSGKSSSKSSASTTATGEAIDTRWGPVQVEITVRDGKVTAATAIEYPENNGRDQQINAEAIPILEQESIGVSNANIDAVSGATYTSGGYIQSLQNALTKAGI